MFRIHVTHLRRDKSDRDERIAFRRRRALKGKNVQLKAKSHTLEFKSSVVYAIVLKLFGIVVYDGEHPRSTGQILGVQ